LTVEALATAPADINQLYEITNRLTYGESAEITSELAGISDRPTFLRCSRQYNTIQYNKYNTAQHSTTQHNTTQYNTIQYNTTQYNTTQHSTTQHNTIQYNTVHLITFVRFLDLLYCIQHL
jgi:hypothetical protein